MTVSIEYTAYIAVDYLPEDQIDPFGKARLREQARESDLVLVGEVTRVEDVPVTGVPASNPDGSAGIAYVEIGSPEAGGETLADARRIRWSIAVQPVIALASVKVYGAVLRTEAGPFSSSAMVPEQVTASGGLVEFKHGFDAEPSAIHAYTASGTESGYSYAIALDEKRSEILLPPGVVRLTATPTEEETEETPA